MRTTATMAPSMKKYLLLFLTVADAVLLQGGNAWSWFPKRTAVQIINNLSNHQKLTLHCKAKDQDIPEQNLDAGKMFEFKFFKDPVLNDTLYFCNFRWPSDTSFHYFDVYVEERDDWCNPCTWTITESGPCQNKCFPWNPPKPHSTFAPIPVSMSDNTNPAHNSHHP